MKKYLPFLFVFLLVACNDENSHSESKELSTDKNSPQAETPANPKLQIDSTYNKFWCSTQILKRTSENIEDLGVSLAAQFLATFSSSCKDNVEYSEWANELLFELIAKHPGYLLQLLHKNNSLDKETIKQQLEKPVHDGIDLEMIIKNTTAAEAPKEIKDEILAVLEKARARS
ncbi:MAG: hypothetical protein MRZ79_27390 [Bacteroidia bacterium]|nr:hypothetical protein [Bacteroidia bacterium]